MTYFAPSDAGTGSSDVPHPGQVQIRKLTQSQGARSEYYETRDATAKKTAAISREPRSPSRERRQLERSVPRVAHAEHVDRLLRDCQVTTTRLIDAHQDPIRSALFGATLLSLLQELWAYRDSREEDWIELLNLAQIMLAKEEFETFSMEKRHAVARLIRDGLTGREIGPADVRRSLEALTAAGFDIWRGIEDFDPEQ